MRDKGQGSLLSGCNFLQALGRGSEGKSGMSIRARGGRVWMHKANLGRLAQAPQAWECSSKSMGAAGVAGSEIPTPKSKRSEEPQSRARNIPGWNKQD